MSEKKALDDWLESMHQRIKTAPEATAWIRDYVGDYVSDELGTASISKHAEGFRIAFESWSSDLGVEEQLGGSRQIVLTSAPWQGSIKLQLADDPNTLLFHSVQTQYKFVRVSD